MVSVVGEVWFRAETRLENTGFLVSQKGRRGGMARGKRPHLFACSQSMMAGSALFLVIFLLCAFPGPGGAGRPMPKLAERKLCADEECSRKSGGTQELGVWVGGLCGNCCHFPSIPSPDPISMAVALQDYVAPDCRFLTIHRGQIVYVFSKLKGRGRLFWGGSVQGEYYGDLAARLGYFPSSIVREDQTLKPGKVDVKTDKWDFYCQ
ncbi:PREDICTED: melanoma-derived growth regulatory protein isoform X1 [Dipodomys ordii]|uniref:Melanoma-derived growth regulatory protein isoform X1 n=1 Tax=Dipodomys ordii TaxID=10020 RepID=A0A1S3GH70_DIPOR|nr:PREDICTED: melanoma-derived growth regulatory protein isoform X1 [Dipodomys ordii]